MLQNAAIRACSLASYSFGIELPTFTGNRQAYSGWKNSLLSIYQKVVPSTREQQDEKSRNSNRRRKPFLLPSLEKSTAHRSIYKILERVQLPLEPSQTNIQQIGTPSEQRPFNLRHQKEIKKGNAAKATRGACNMY